MTREGADAKAARLLANGAVHVMYCDERAVVARVRGTSAIYDVAWSRDDGRWHCTCQNLGRCSHRRAVEVVTMRSAGS